MKLLLPLLLLLLASPCMAQEELLLSLDKKATSESEPEAATPWPLTFTTASTGTIVITIVKTAGAVTVTSTAGTVTDNEDGTWSVAFDGAAGTKTVTINDNAGGGDITTLNISACGATGYVPDLSALTNLTTFNGSINAFTDYTSFVWPVSLGGQSLYLNNNALSETAVNGILVDFAAGPGLMDVEASFYLHEGTNAAPSGTGLTAVATLQSHGWSVYYNGM